MLQNEELIEKRIAKKAEKPWALYIKTIPYFEGEIDLVIGDCQSIDISGDIAKIRASPLKHRHLQMAEFLLRRNVCTFSLRSTRAGRRIEYIFEGTILGIQHYSVPGNMEMEYEVKIYKWIKNGFDANQGQHGSKNLQQVRGKKPRRATKNTLGRKRDRKTVRKTNLVRVPVGNKKGVRRKNSKVVRNGGAGGKPNSRKLVGSRSRGKTVRSKNR